MKYVIEIGVFVEDSERDEKFSIGINNAQLLYIHENGSPLNHIPARPVLEMTIRYAKENLLDKYLNKALEAYIKSGFDREVFEKSLESTICNKMENYAKDIIYSNDGRLVPNSPSVARAKWEKAKHSKGSVWTYPDGNHPLFDTGNLARSIKCRLVKVD